MSDDDVVCSEAECDIKRDKNISKKLELNSIEKDREVLIERLMESYEIMDREGAFLGFDIPKSKNIVQSIVHLILNDEFYDSIVRMRIELGVPKDGFSTKGERDDWTERYTRDHCADFNDRVEHSETLKEQGVIGYEGPKRSVAYNDANEKMAKFISDHGLAYERDVPRLVDALSGLLLFSLDETADNFIRRFSSCLLRERVEKMFPILDVEREYVGSVSSDRTRWRVRVYPFSNASEILKAVEDYFVREESIKPEAGIYEKKTPNRKPHPATLKLKTDTRRGVLVLEFESDRSTKLSEIRSLYKKEHSRIVRLQNELEQKKKAVQKRSLGSAGRLRLQYRIYVLRCRHKLTYREVDVRTGKEGLEMSGKTNTIKGEYGKMKVSVTESMKRKILF